MKPGMLLRPSSPKDEIHLQHDGTEWVVSSHVDAPHRFEHLAEAMKYANHLRDQHPGEDRLRVVLHRAAGPLAK
jgi:hypothetical protein